MGWPRALRRFISSEDCAASAMGLVDKMGDSATVKNCWVEPEEYDLAGFLRGGRRFVEAVVPVPALLGVVALLAGGMGALRIGIDMAKPLEPLPSPGRPSCEW